MTTAATLRDVIDVRLVAPAAVGWIVAGVVIGVPAAHVPVLVGAWLAAGVSLAAGVVWRQSWCAVVALACVAAALCASSMALQAPHRFPPELASDSFAERSLELRGVTTERLAVGATRLEAQITILRTPDRAIAGSMAALIFLDEPADKSLALGSSIAVTARIEATPAGDATALLAFAGEPIAVVGAPHPAVDWANGLRASFLDASSALPGDGGDLLAGLAIGDESAVTESLDEAMKAGSLTHLTAVSGANCAVVVGLIMLAGRALGVARSVRVIAALVVLAAFVVLVTPQPSVLRAAVMAALVLVALLSGRPVRGVAVLSLAVVGLLVFDPWLAREYGFVLSVFATAGLVVLAGPLARVLARWLPGWLSAVVAVPLAAQLACQPVIILLEASLPTYGVVANLLAAPAAPVATVVGLAACVALAFFAPLGVLLCHIAWLPSAWIAAVARFTADLPFASLPWPPGLLGLALLAGLSAAMVTAVLATGTLRRVCAAVVVLGLVAYLGVVGGGRAIELATRPGDWQIAACDVGQGDAVLVRSAGEVALIDTGPEPEPLEACLTDLGITHVDVLVLTHFDIDHVGGVDAVAGRADLVIAGPGEEEDERVLDGLRARGATVEHPTRGDSGLLGDLRWRALWPPDRLSGLSPGNDTSLVLAFEGVGECRDRCVSSVFLGDLGEETQLRMLGAGSLTAADVVKVSHHGSGDQSPEVYERVDAAVGVIGVGADNGYGHPTRDALDLLANVGTSVSRTDAHGLVLISPGESPGSLEVWTER